jgi:hypothetical protein
MINQVSSSFTQPETIEVKTETFVRVKIKKIIKQQAAFKIKY